MIMFPSYSPLFTMGLLAEHARDDASAIYFTLQTGKRDTLELRSFLYLDLAGHPPSHRRKYSTLSKSTSWTCMSDAKSIHDHPRTERLTPTPVLPTRRRASKESLRSIPSPKPAPSTTLPNLPFSVSPSPPSPLLLSVPSKKRYISTGSSHSPTPRARRPAPSRSESICSHDRRKSHMDALACLEGRSRVPNRVPRASALRNNFMSFSDDEDEKSRKSGVSKEFATPVTHVDDVSAFADVEDEVDAVIPTISPEREAADKPKPTRTARPAPKRRSTIESWFPLKSFIDLKDDDLSSWNWRSFIEIGGIS